MREQGSAPAHLGLGHTLIIAILLFAGAGTVGNLNVFLLLLLGLACAEPAAQASRIRTTSAGNSTMQRPLWLTNFSLRSSG